MYYINAKSVVTFAEQTSEKPNQLLITINTEMDNSVLSDNAEQYVIDKIKNNIDAGNYRNIDNKKITSASIQDMVVNIVTMSSVNFIENLQPFTAVLHYE